MKFWLKLKLIKPFQLMDGKPGQMQGNFVVDR